MNRVLLITEKLHHSQELVRILERDNVFAPNTLFDLAHLWRASWWQYPLPDNLPMAKLPYLNLDDFVPEKMEMRPQFKDKLPHLAQFDRENLGSLSGSNGFAADSQTDPMEIYAKRWDQYDQILICVNSDPTGWGSVAEWLRMLHIKHSALGLSPAVSNNDPRIQTLVIDSGINTDSVRKSYQAKTGLNHPEIDACIKYYDYKRLFDHFWNTNSKALLNEFQVMVGVQNPIVMSKYMLMTLHILNHYQAGPLGNGISPKDALSTVEVQSGLMGWRGTGKYIAKDQIEIRSSLATLFYNPIDNPPTGDRKYSYHQRGIGSPMSVRGILENLEALGFIYTKNDLIQVSEKGQRFLSLLAPGLFSPDMPFRLDDWFMTSDLMKMNRFIRTEFGKQKRRLLQLQQEKEEV